MATTIAVATAFMRRPGVEGTVFEGTVTFAMDELVISKETFLFKFVITDTKEDEKVCIVFEDEAPPLPEEVLHPEEKPVNVRKLQKQRVMDLRTKAARALFHAERLTQEYYNQFGEDTEWEDEAE